MPFRIVDRYLIWLYLSTLFALIGVISLVVLIFDAVELLRVAGNRNIDFSTIALMAVMKNPLHLQKIMGFITILASLISFSRLNRANEYLIFKACGLSIWRVLLPILCSAMLFGVIFTTVLNPFIAYFASSYQKMEASHLKGHANLLSVDKTGLWIRQVSKNGDESIIHALRISPQESTLHDVTFYYLDENGSFYKRYDTEKAILDDHYWSLSNVRTTSSTGVVSQHSKIELETNLTFAQIKESMAFPESISFWKLNSFISMAEESGFSVAKHKYHLFKLALMPIFLVAASMLGVAFAISNNRTANIIKEYFSCLIFGFILYFVSDVLYALAASGSLQVILAVIIPILFTAFFAIYLLIKKEEAKI